MTTPLGALGDWGGRRGEGRGRGGRRGWSAKLRWLSASVGLGDFEWALVLRGGSVKMSGATNIQRGLLSFEKWKYENEWCN